MVTDTWFTVELPMLRTLVEMFEETDHHTDLISVDAVAAHMNVPVAVVGRSLTKLWQADPPYIVVELPSHIRWVTERARQATGQWPTPQGFAEGVTAAIEAALTKQIAEEPDEVAKSKLVAMRDAIAHIGQRVITDVAVAYLDHKVGA